MSSHLAQPHRRVPQQERGRERVAGLLEAAASAFADMGYEAATMSEIAARAGASIGSLYQFFPSKESITECLLEQYCEELRGLWSDTEQFQSETIEDLAKRLVGQMIIFLDHRPALVALMGQPCKPKNTSLRDLLRGRLARILRATSKHLSKTRAQFLATVVLELLKGMKELYAEFEGNRRRAVVREYERLLTNYLEMQLATERASRKRKV